jgi:hypothetical protein
MVSGIYSILRIGLLWGDLSEEFAPLSSVYALFRRW